MTVAIVAGVFTIKQVTLSKTVKPFVIQIEDRNGAVEVVTPTTIQTITADEAINRYFVIKYIKARETYSFMDYEYNYNTIVRLMSDRDVYRRFLLKFDADSTNPVKRYGTRTMTNISIRSIQYLQPGRVEGSDMGTNVRVAQIRFKLTEEGALSGEYDKIVTMSYIFEKSTISDDDKFVNPLGFKVISYRIDDEKII